MARLEQIPSSYKLASGKWVPRLTKRIHTGNTILEKKIDDWDERFDTQEEADAFAIASLKKTEE